MAREAGQYTEAMKDAVYTLYGAEITILAGDAGAVVKRDGQVVAELPGGPDVAGHSHQAAKQGWNGGKKTAVHRVPKPAKPQVIESE